MHLKNWRRRQAGVTLMELMAVIIILGILGVIAIPGYQRYVMRAHRGEAKAALLRLQTNQERFYLNNRTYGTVDDLVAQNLLDAGALSERGSYVITIAEANATTYSATATPVEGGAYDMREDEQCTSFSITAQGVRTATGSDAANCW
jgi:type IV pilus assembly protein PilE